MIKISPHRTFRFIQVDTAWQRDSYLIHSRMQTIPNQNEYSSNRHKKIISQRKLNSKELSRIKKLLDKLFPTDDYQ